MAESLTSVVGAVKGLGVIGVPAAIAIEGHPVLAVIISIVAVVVWMLTPVAQHIRQWMGDSVGRRLGTLPPSPPVNPPAP